MATAYLLCELAASGKTTLARQLAREKGAVRFTLDERMRAKTDLTIFDEAYGRLVRQEKDQIWEEAKRLLDQGTDVVLDWSLWNRQARREWTQKVSAAGHDYKLFYLEVPLETLKERLSLRNAQALPAVHYIPVEELERFSHIFEPPSPEENLKLEVI